MICNYRYALLLVGLIALPAFASDTHSWSFNGTEYVVTVNGAESSVVVRREHAVTTRQMKSICRKGLGLGLRKQYEDKLIEKDLISERLDSWPFTNLTYELSNIQFSSLKTTQAACTATVNDSGYKTNFETTALNYAIAYYETRQFSDIKPLLPVLMKEASVSMDAAGLVTLLLAQSDTNKANSYYHQYLDSSLITRNEIKQWLAQWKFDQGQLEESRLIAKSCTSSKCEHLVLDIEEMQFERQAESAGDLSSYF